jgi:MFS transporter, Spinster family, sphingosine-1-phosphate transporter
VIRRPSFVLVLLTGLNLLNYLDRFVLSAVLPKIQDDLHLSNFVAGSLATVFLIGFFATSPIFGSLADSGRPGARPRLVALGIGVWSLATVASGLVKGAKSLVSARAVVGVGEASYTTIAPALLDDIAPPARKARWMSIFSVATPVGAALGYIVGGALEHATGSWRAPFLVAGGPGVLLALLCLLLRDPPRGQTSEAPPLPWRAAVQLVRIPALARAVFGFCAYNFAMGGFAFWAPKYIASTYGMEVGEASFQFGLVTVGGGFVGTLLGGLMCDARIRTLERRGRYPDAAASAASLEVCALSALVGAPLAAAALLSPTAGAFYACAFACEVGLFLSGGPINIAVLKSAPLALRASAMAVTIFAIHALGDMWSPLLIGLAWDHAPGVWAMMFIPAAFAAGALIWWDGAKKGYLLPAG